jgi:hypothetical protein
MLTLVVEIRVEPKDEPYPGALETTADNVVSRTRDILADQFKHDEIVRWTLRGIEIMDWE